MSEITEFVWKNGNWRVVGADDDEERDDLIHQWRKSEGSGESIKDYVSRFSGSISGNVSWVSGDWEGGYALDFEEGYVSTGAAAPSGSMTLISTIEVPEEITQRRTIQSWQQSVDPGARVLELSNDGDNELSGFIVNDTEEPQRISYETTLEPEEKHRVAFIIDGENSEMKLARNGIIVETMSFDGELVETLSNHKIGRRADSDERHFVGAIDNSKIYTDALDDSALQADYDNQPWS